MKLTAEQRKVRKASPRGKQFGSEPWQFDPYDGLTDEEFAAEVAETFAAAKTVPVSIRLPRSLLQETKAEAERRGIPYQALIRALIELSLNRLKRAT